MSFNMLPHMQFVELPLDIWAAVRDVLTHKEWAMACGTCQASRALSRPLVAAKVCNVLGQGEQNLLKQLQLERWSGCHSLFFNLQHIHETMKVAPIAAQIEQLSVDGSLSSLHCLHIIGRGQVPFTESSAEGLLTSLLAKHASVLTLDIMTLSMPLDLPKLQHLILYLGTTGSAGVGPGRCTHEALFPAISRLTSLETLYVQSSRTTIRNKTDLAACVHLQCVALQGVRLEGGVVLPLGCLLHVFHRTQHGDTIKHTVGDMVTGIDMYHASCRDHIFLHTYAVDMLKLTRLRLTVDKQYDCKHGEGVLIFYPSIMPALKVLELDMQCEVWLELQYQPGFALETLIVIAAGLLTWFPKVCEAPMTTLKQMYLKSGEPFLPGCRKYLQESYAKEPQAKLRLLDYIEEGQNSWTAQMPAGFQPGNLQKCWCGACSNCLVQAGVPILCDQAWTSYGFSKHLRPHCNGWPDIFVPRT